MKHILPLCLFLLSLSILGCGSTSTTTNPPCVCDYILNSSGLLFDGNTAKITVPDADDLFLGGGSYTLEAWVKVTPYGYFQWILVKSTVTPDLDYLLGVNRNDHFTLQINGLATIVEDVNTVIEAGRYYHVAAVVDKAASVATIYINGVPTASSPLKGSAIKVANRLDIGGHNTESLPKQETWHGVIYNVSIWNTAKTAEEIKGAMYQTLKGDEAGLVATWNLDEGTGTVATDKTGKHNGTIVGNAQWVKMPY